MGFWVLGFGFRILDSGFWVLGFEFWVLGFGFSVLFFWSRVLEKDFEFRVEREARRWERQSQFARGSGSQILDFGARVHGPG